MDPHGLRIPVAKHGKGHGVLVDIQADEEVRSGHELVSCAVRLEAACGSGARCDTEMLIHGTRRSPALPLCLADTPIDVSGG